MNKPIFHNDDPTFHPQGGRLYDDVSVSSLDRVSPIGPYHRANDPTVRLPGDSLGETIVIRPSLRTHRRDFTIACTLFTIGSLLILFSSPWSKELIAPGPLSSHHAPLAAHENGDRCAACHAAANGSLVSWIAGLFSAEQERGVSQSELCMRCHESSISSQFAMNPHNIVPERLKLISSQRDATRLPNWLHSPVNHQNEIACSTCHQEHHGGHQLTTLTDSQCQTCHSKSFSGFEHGHPEFTNYPQQRRSRIAFDHASHFGRHFVEQGQVFDCAMCHLDDSYQNVKRLAPFEQSCAKCHNDQILDSVADGLVLMSLPMLDMRAIEAAGLEVGGWPLAATGDFDGAIPPLMRILLLADSAAQTILSQRGNKFEFFDLEAENRSDVQDAVTLVWAIKRLLGDLANNGPLELKKRFDLVLGVNVSKPELSQLITTLDHSAFFTMAQAWVPGLPQELNRAGRAVNTLGQGPSITPEANWPEGNAITNEHRMDGPAHPQNFVNQQFVEELIHDLKSGESAKPASPFFLASSTSRQPRVDDDWLASNPLVELMQLANEKSDSVSNRNLRNEAPNGGAESGAGRGIAEERLPTESKTEPKSAELTDSPIESAIERTGPTALSSAFQNDHNEILFDSLNRPSGWYRNDTTFQISYRAAGHADPSLKAWIDFVARVPNLEERPELETVMTKVLSARGIGQCQACHTVDRIASEAADQRLTVNWRAEYRDPAVRGFTKFSHAPHLVHAELKDCSKCHQLEAKRSNATSFLGFDPTDVISNFRPIVKSDCIQCHQQGRTNSSCMMCHHYHVELSR